METAFFRYTLTLRAPLLVPAVEGGPGGVRTARAVPGSVIRGALAGGLGGAAHPEFHALVLSGRVRCLPAYPAPDGARGLPVPLSWRREKDGPDNRIVDLAAEVDGGEENGRAEPQLIAPSARYFIPGAQLRSVPVEVESRVHHQRDRDKGRATKARGALFTYEALPAGTPLSGIVAVTGEDGAAVERTIESVRKALGQPLRIGRSRQTQYGGEAETSWDGEHANREVGIGWSALLESDVQAGQCFRLLLTSDAIVRDLESGQVDPAALGSVITARLGGRARVGHRYTGTRIVSGFNTMWRLALPQVPAAAAGTVLVLEATADIPVADLFAVEHVGVGERRAEGFGACLFLSEAERELRLKTAHPEPRRPERPGDRLPPELEGVQQRLFSVAMERAVARQAARLTDNVVGRTPSPSLLGRLRTPLRRGEGGLDELRRWLGGDEERLRRRAMDQLEACRLKSDGRHDQQVHLDDWLRRLLDDGDASLDHLHRGLFAGEALERYSLLGTVSLEKRRELAKRARRDLLDAVFAALARWSRQEEP